jgi:hypothetical protein
MGYLKRGKTGVPLRDFFPFDKIKGWKRSGMIADSLHQYDTPRASSIPPRNY